MARGQKQKTRGAQYVAEAALTDVVQAHLDTDTHLDEEASNIVANEIAKSLVRQAWDVEHFPVAGKVTITFDLADLDKPADPQA